MIPAVMPTYARSDVAFVRGEGAYLYDAADRRYLDFCAGVAVNALGHAHPRLVAALKAQAERLWHCSNLYRIPEQDRLAERLVAASFADTVFFCNSGAEAVECAIKMARKYHDETGTPERYRIIVARDAFHGRTLATVTAGGQERHIKGFDPLVDGFDRVPYGDLDAVASAIGPHTAAVLVEPVQGEGGVRLAPDGYLAGLRDLADRHGLLLMLDEVQTGMGRTGRLFGYEHAGITPDVISVAKGLGGGFPVGACLATARAAVGMTPGTHASTFGGNPLAMAVGNAVLDVMLDDGFLSRIEPTGARLRAGLERLVSTYPTVLADVRGIGLMLGVKCVVPNTEVSAALLGSGLLTVVAGDNVLRLLPPLIIGAAEVDEALERMDSTCNRIAKGNDRAA